MRPLAPFVAATGLVLALAAAAPTTLALPGAHVGETAPDFTLTTIDGKRVRLSDYRGKVLVINVWGSWCPPCRIETPDLVAEATANAGRVAFLGVDTTESASVVRAFAVAKAIPYPQVATSTSSAFARDYDVRSYPTTFVIDARGVLRARHADNLLGRTQLHAYIAAAQRGESAPLESAFQRRLDELLDPARFPFTGDPTTVRANVVKADRAIAKANDLLDEAMNDPSRDHDVDKTQAEEETLRAAAIAALAPIASDAADATLLARLRGDEAAALLRWAEADAQYQRALASTPHDAATLAADAYAVARLGDDARVVQIDETLAALAPSAERFVVLGRARAKLRDRAGAESSFAKARELAAHDPARLAWTNLYEGQMEANAGDMSKARAAFMRASDAAAAIPATDPRKAWYLERAQEGTVALGVASNATPTLSIAPWTGADLPGSIASTIKYRLVVTGKAGTTVALAAAGLPAHWIGSFCSDRVCAPFRTEVTLPPDGVKVVEFQVVPTTAAKARFTVRIEASSGGRRVATVRTVVPV
ncbi:MAG TPA: TlpA disulfide reductase family protein [Candidatus Acidoferrum sp.]|nr:TlpA disulfide reductase family protein [Candidatus Acidoferrum sp.]